LPEAKAYKIKIIIGGHVIVSEKAKNKIRSNYNFYNQRFTITTELPYCQAS